MKPSVIIVGAGAAGLMAARELSARKWGVTLLESRGEAGGRIRTYQAPDGVVVEGGAEFIHGKLPVTLGLCDEAGIGYVAAEGKMYRRERNEWVEEDQMIEGWDTLIRKMRSADEDMTLHAFLAKHYPGDKHTELRRHINAYVQGFDLADPKQVSVQALYREWSHEEQQNFRIPGGYKKLVDFLERQCLDNGCTIVKGEAVRQIDWQKNDVTAYTASGKKYAAAKILVAAPVSILADIAGRSAVNFTPPIDDHIRAAAGIGFGTVIKIVILFSTSFWQEDTGFIFSEEVFPTWWTQLPSKNNTLTGWTGGPAASNLSGHPDDELLEIALTSLSHIFNKDMSEIKKNVLRSYVFNWQADPDARGGYSYPTPGTPGARKVFNTPMAGTVFFAGECFYEGEYPGTVEAALASGKQVARQMLSSL